MKEIGEILRSKSRGHKNAQKWTKGTVMQKMEKDKGTVMQKMEKAS